MLNDLHEAMKNRQGQEACILLLEELKDYARVHFTTEERLFDRHGYPDASKHVVEHEKFIEKILDFDLECQERGKVSALSVCSFLRDWLTRHIQGSDKKFGPFLNAKGVR